MKTDNKETNKFIKYYNIYKINENNDKFIENTIKINIETSKNELINKTLVYDDIKFLDDALNLILDYNRILKYTFIFHCFLALNSNVNVFEYTFKYFQIIYNEFLELIESDKISSIIIILFGEIFNKNFIELKKKILSLIDLLNEIKKVLIKEIENNLYDKIDYLVCNLPFHSLFQDVVITTKTHVDYIISAFKSNDFSFYQLINDKRFSAYKEYIHLKMKQQNMIFL